MRTPTRSEEELKEKQRSIRLEGIIWNSLDDEAKACGRTPLQQLRQILLTYFELDLAEISKERITKAQSQLKPHRHENNHVPKKKTG